ncbi:hypothetical protein D3C71_1732500 [compost metagenome]
MLRGMVAGTITVDMDMTMITTTPTALRTTTPVLRSMATAMPTNTHTPIRMGKRSPLHRRLHPHAAAR